MRVASSSVGLADGGGTMLNKMRGATSGW